jgi:hypothetical protein
VSAERFRDKADGRIPPPPVAELVGLELEANASCSRTRPRVSASLHDRSSRKRWPASCWGVFRDRSASLATASRLQTGDPWEGSASSRGLRESWARPAVRAVIVGRERRAFRSRRSLIPQADARWEAMSFGSRTGLTGMSSLLQRCASGRQSHLPGRPRRARRRALAPARALSGRATAVRGRAAGRCGRSAAPRQRLRRPGAAAARHPFVHAVGGSRIGRALQRSSGPR